MKKVFTRLLYALLVVFVIAGILKVLVMFISNLPHNEPQQNDQKIYEIVNVEKSLIQTLAYGLLRPLIESRINYYIKKNGLEDYLKKIKHKIKNKELFKTYDINPGSGKQALCGHEVTSVIYKVDIPQSDKFSQQKLTQEFLRQNNNPTIFKIGSHEIKALNYAIEGMKEGGERVVMIETGDEDNSASDDNSNIINKFTNYYVKLLSVKATYPQAVENLLIFDNNSEDNSELGNPVRCGDKVSVQYTIREYNGKPILENKKIDFIAGQNKAPLAIELGVLNMKSGIERSVITPIELLNNLIDLKSGEIQYDKKSIKIINFKVETPITKTDKPLLDKK